jgi:hypothetical protein
MNTIVDYTAEQEMEAGANWSKVERENPELAKRAQALCEILGLFGFWRRVNSARWEIAKALIEESKHGQTHVSGPG